MEVKNIENFLNGICSVIASRIKTENDEIKEIHIVSDISRSPKQIMRDVESVLISQFDIHIDYKIISIAQIENKSSVPKDFRFKLNGIDSVISENVFEAKIRLEKQGEIYEGFNQGIATSNNIPKILALAAIDAIEKGCGKNNIFALEDISKIIISGKETVITVITALIEEQEVTICGSAANAKNSNELVVKSTLDALNRIIPRFVS